MADAFYVRIGNFVPDSPELDVLVDGYPVLTGIEFGEINDYTEHRADEYAVAVTPSGEEERLLEERIDFEADTHYTLLLIGTRDRVQTRLLVDGTRGGR